MIKRILGRFRREPGLHKATVRIDFYPQDQVTPHIFWHRSQDPESDTIPLVIFGYARILFELSEMNEVRVARELMVFLDRVCQRVLSDEGPPRRPRLPLGQLRLVNDQALPALRTYELEFYELPARRLPRGISGQPGERGVLLARRLSGPAAILPGPPGGPVPPGNWPADWSVSTTTTASAETSGMGGR